jgi:hypothetical protein
LNTHAKGRIERLFETLHPGPLTLSEILAIKEWLAEYTPT